MEEQFYFIFPIVLVIAVLARGVWSQRSRIAVAVGLVTGVSFTVMMLRHAGLVNVTWLNFYDPIQRAWEFGVGSPLALVPLRFLAGRKLLSVTASVAGIVLFVAALVLLRDPQSYPGPLALLPVAAAACLIAAGSTGTGPVSKALSSRPFVMIGDGSYSIYLWHWPAVSFAVLLGFESTWLLGAAVLVSMIPAWASYRFVETPLRVRMHHHGSVSWRVPAITWLAPLMAVAVVSVLPQPTTGYEGTSGINYLAFIDENSVPCEFASAVVAGTRCRQTSPGVHPSVVVIGDSHGEHLFPGLIEQASSIPAAYLYLEDWPSIVSVDSQSIPRAIADLETVDTVLLSARWNAVNVGSPQLIETITVLQEAGKKVIILDDVPYFEFHAMECEYVRVLGPRPQCTMNVSDYQQLKTAYRAELERISRDTGAEFIEVGDVFCRDETCSMVKDGVLQYADNGHLNVQGSRTVVQELMRTDIPLAAAG